MGRVRNNAMYSGVYLRLFPYEGLQREHRVMNIVTANLLSHPTLVEQLSRNGDSLKEVHFWLLLAISSLHGSHILLYTSL